MFYAPNIIIKKTHDGVTYKTGKSKDGRVTYVVPLPPRTERSEIHDLMQAAEEEVENKAKKLTRHVYKVEDEGESLRLERQR